MSALSRARNVATPALRASLLHRAIHVSVPIAAKRKGKDFAGEMFDSGSRVRESYVFGASTTAPQLAPDTEAVKEVVEEVEKDPFRAMRRKKFNEQLLYARKLLRSKVHWERRLVRHGVLRRLIALADTPEQLRNIAALFPDWALQGYILDDDTATTYIGRCIAFGRPQIAVTLLLNPHKHKFNLPSLPVARKLLQALIESGSTLRNAISFAALYTVYLLPPAASDPASAAMIIDACIKKGTPEALEIAKQFSEGVSSTTVGKESTRIEREWRARLDGLSASVQSLIMSPPAPDVASQATATATATA